MHALRLDIRQESFQTMCTQGHEYKINDLDVRPSANIIRLPSPVAIKEETYGIGNRLVTTRTDLLTSTRQFQKKDFDFVAALSSAAEI